MKTRKQADSTSPKTPIARPALRLGLRELDTQGLLPLDRQGRQLYSQEAAREKLSAVYGVMRDEESKQLWKKWPAFIKSLNASAARPAEPVYKRKSA